MNVYSISVLRRFWRTRAARVGICLFAVLVTTAAQAVTTQYSGPDPYADFDPSYHGKFLRVRLHGVSIRVDDVDWTAKVGKRFRLFQKSPTHFVVVLQSDVEGVRLGAFQARQRSGAGTAWVTNEGHLIFGKETESCRHRFYFHRSERLPVIDETPTTYLVLVERYGSRVTLEVPKGLRGMELDVRPVPPRPAAEDNPQSKRVVLTGPSSDAVDALAGPGNPVPSPLPARKATPAADTDTEKPLVTRFKEVVMKEVLAASGKADQPGPEAGSTGVAAVAVVTPDSPPVLPVPLPPVEPVPAKPEPVPVAADEPKPDPETIAVVAVSTAAPPAVVATAEAETAAAGEPPVSWETTEPAADTAPAAQGTGQIVNFLSGQTLRIEILLFVCIVEGALIVSLRRTNRRTMLADASVLEFAVDRKDLAEDTGSSANGGSAVESGTHLSGSIAQFPINQVIQLLHTSGESGVLWVALGDGARMHKLFFLRGRLVDAVMGSQSGMDCLVDVLKSNKGSFSFKREDTSSHEPQFTQETMSLLLKATRLLDEQA